MATVVGKWEGGRVKQLKDGTQVYYIRKRLNGRLIEASTGCNTLAAALKHLVRFQENPEAYNPAGALPGAKLTVAGKMDDYLAWCANKARPNSVEWIREKRLYLKWWSEKLTTDLRRLTKKAVLDALGDAAGDNHNRLGSLKTFCTWLRDVDGTLSRKEDVTLDIKNPTQQPAQWAGPPRAISRKVYEATLKEVSATYKDIVILLAGTGMHVREAGRLASGQGSIAGTTLVVFHKKGAQHRMVVTPEVAEAAAKVVARGAFNSSRLATAIKKAATTAGVEEWAPGALRHSFVSWKVAEGVSLQAIADYTNHDINTLKRFYNAAAIPLPR